MSSFFTSISLATEVINDVFLGIDYMYDNDEGDGFILAVDGDETIGRLILEKDVERVEFEDD